MRDAAHADQGQAFPLEIRGSISSQLAIAAFLAIISGYGLFHQEKYITLLGITLYWILLSAAGAFMLFKIFQLANRKVIMRIDDEGIYHADFDLMKWADILSIKKKRSGSSEQEIVYFMFQTTKSAQPFAVNISELDITEGVLIHAIRKFRDFNIYEIIYDD